MARHVKEGQGWRLGWNPDATVFQGLVGGDRWAVEMTQAEFADFCRLATQLADTLEAMTSELMDEERIACEQETDQIWVEVEGFPGHFTLRFMVLSGRQVEGAWPPTATRELLQAIPALTVF
jgi:hypothetical protein